MLRGSLSAEAQPGPRVPGRGVPPAAGRMGAAQSCPLGAGPAAASGLSGSSASRTVQNAARRAQGAPAPDGPRRRTRRSPAMPSPDFVFPLTGKVHARRADTASRGALSGPTAPSQAEPTAVSPWLPGRHLLVRLRPWCAAQTYSGTQKRPEPPSGVRGPWVRGGCRTPHAPDPAVPRGAAESSTG